MAKYYSISTLDGGENWESPVELSDVGSAALKPSGLHVATQLEGTAWATVDTPGGDEWCHYVDFTTGQHGWNVYNDGAFSAGQYNAGAGFSPTDVEIFGIGARLFQIEYTFSGQAFITSFTLYYDYTFGHVEYTGGIVYPLHLNQSSNDATWFQIDRPDMVAAGFDGTDKTFHQQHPSSVYTVNNGIRLRLTTSQDNFGAVTYDGSALLRGIEFRGVGTNPFPTDDCEGSEGLLVFKTSDYGDTWQAIDAINLETASAGLLVPYPDPDARYLFVGNYVDGASELPGLVADDSNNLIRTDLLGGSTNISPVFGGETYGPVFVSGVNAPRESIAFPSGNLNICYMIGSEKVGGKIGLFMTQNALATSPEWSVLIAPDVSVPYRKLVLDSRELYLIGINGQIAYTDAPHDGSTIDDRTGDLSTSAEILSIAGWIL